ncbi:hypothetical protein LCGC14_1094240 [marine sediment metagenome]|uniref:Uncharacterized protein n=1 Tax=marine sediment metagenome TaxID=412755 RepID=A0A0F9QHK7_9ZZZZ
MDKRIRDNFKKAYQAYRKEFMKDTIKSKHPKRTFLGAIGGFDITVIDGTIWLRNYFDMTEVRLYRHEIKYIISLLTKAENLYGVN